MTSWRWTLRELSRRRGRSILTILGVVLGVAALVATWITADTTREAARTMFGALGGRAELEVEAVGQGGVDATLLETVRSTEGVDAAVPVARGTAALRTPSGVTPLKILGIDPARDGAVRSLRVVDGVGLGAADGVLLEAGFARSVRIAVGSEIDLFALGGRRVLPVVGLLGPGGVSDFDGGAIGILRLDGAQDLLGLGNDLTAVQVTVTRAAGLERVAERLRTRLPEGHLVDAPEDRGALSRDTMRSVEQGLSAVSVMSLVAGAFIVLNTFLMSTGERRRSLALLRALGMKRTQILRMVLKEAALLATLGTVLGVAIGVGTAAAMVRSLEGFLGLAIPGLRWSATPFVLAAIVGPTMALLATWLPARDAARRPVLADLFPARRLLEERIPAGLTRTGLALLAATGLGLVGFVTRTVSEAFVAPTMAVALMGFVLVLPRLVPTLLRLAARPAERVLGIEGRLAVRHLRRRPMRTSLTSGVLMLAVIVGIGMGNAIRGNMRAFGDWYEETLTADFFLRAAMPDSATLSAPVLPPEVPRAVADLPGVTRVMEVTFQPVRVNGQRALLIARTVEANEALGFGVAEETPDAIREGLLRGEAGLGVLLADRLGVGPGDTITLLTPKGERTIRVTGLITSYTVGGATVFLARSVAVPMLDLRGAHALLVEIDAGAQDVATASLEGYAADNGFLLQTNAELRSTVDAMLGGVLALLQGMLVLVFAVASLGVINTLTMNVLEQTRELGLLRAVGMTRSQVRRFVRAQGYLLAAISIPPGLVGGVLMAVLFDVAVAALAGLRTPFVLDVWLLVVCPALALGTALVAALLPARRAGRIRIFAALAYE